MRKPLCVLLRRFATLCTQRFVLCMEGCGSEARGPAAAMCSGCAAWAGSPPRGGCPCGAFGPWAPFSWLCVAALQSLLAALTWVPLILTGDQPHVFLSLSVYSLDLNAFLLLFIKEVSLEGTTDPSGHLIQTSAWSRINAEFRPGYPGICHSGTFQILLLTFVHSDTVTHIGVDAKGVSLCSYASLGLYSSLFVTIMIFQIPITKQTAEPLLVKHQL